MTSSLSSEKHREVHPKEIESGMKSTEHCARSHDALGKPTFRTNSGKLLGRETRRQQAATATNIRKQEPSVDRVDTSKNMMKCQH
eukprot:3936201-Amphidinium_carterae.1